jgi:hypothetical protein
MQGNERRRLRVRRLHAAVSTGASRLTPGNEVDRPCAPA